MTISEALRRACERLGAVGLARAEWDAELLLRHVLGWDRASLLAGARQQLPPEQAARFFALVEERARRRPLQHLTGVQAFWRHEFLVTADVLIPRPETELIVEAALERLRQRERPRIVDVGTGSGCIALSLAAERPDAEVHATDLSQAALAVAKENARRLGLQGRVVFHHGDLLAPVASLAGSVDAVLSNPPYVDPDSELPPEVRDHEPALALFPPGGAHALYTRLAEGALGLLRPDGVLILELGAGMADAICGAVSDAGFGVERVLPDLQGIPRTLLAVPSQA